MNVVFSVDLPIRTAVVEQNATDKPVHTPLQWILISLAELLFMAFYCFAAL